MSPIYQCKHCNYNFKVKFGNLKSSYISTETLFSPFKRKDCKGEGLAQICQKVGVEVVKCEKYSSRVCNPCARKIRNLGSLYSFVQESIQGKISKSTPTKATPVKNHLLEMPDLQNQFKCYRLWQKQTTENLLGKLWNLGKRGLKHLRRKITIILTSMCT